MTKPQGSGPSPVEFVLRSAFDAFATGNGDAARGYIDPNFRWTYFDPSLDAPVPQTCAGPWEILRYLGNIAAGQGAWELIEVKGFDDRAVVVTKVPEERIRPVWRPDDVNFHVVEVRDGRIVALRAGLDRDEAMRRASAKQSLTN